MPPGDENGVIELRLQNGTCGEIKLIVENTNEAEEIHLKDITLLWSINLFDYSNIAHIGSDKSKLSPGSIFVCP